MEKGELGNTESARKIQWWKQLLLEILSAWRKAKELHTKEQEKDRQSWKYLVLERSATRKTQHQGESELCNVCGAWKRESWKRQTALETFNAGFKKI